MSLKFKIFIFQPNGNRKTFELLGAPYSDCYMIFIGLPRTIKLDMRNGSWLEFTIFGWLAPTTLDNLNRSNNCFEEAVLLFNF